MEEVKRKRSLAQGFSALTTDCPPDMYFMVWLCFCFQIEHACLYYSPL